MAEKRRTGKSVNRVFQTKKISAGEARRRQKVGIEWWQSLIGRAVTAKSMLGRAKNSSNIRAGQLIFFEYSAKHKDTLPYWDKFPLAVIIDVRKDSFLSLNLHYLPPAMRALLIGRLLDTITAKRIRHDTKMRINYGIVSSVAKFNLAAPAIKMHLFSHIKSKILRIPLHEAAEFAIYLPLERFVGASKQQVWKDSRTLIRKGR